MSPLDRGTLVHQTLQNLDLRRPSIPPGLPAELHPLIDAFIASDLRATLATATDVRKEQRFAFSLNDALVTGTFDVLARQPDGSSLVVDYKTDRLNRQAPAAVVQRDYAVQRLIYALAALRAGAQRVEVVHLFLEAADQPVVHSFDADEAERLQIELVRRAAPLLSGRFDVTQTPHRAVCAGCLALGGLCSWPAEMSMRAEADRLF